MDGSALLKPIAGAVVGPLKSWMLGVTYNWRLAHAVVKEAKKQGLGISARSLRSWLARPDVQIWLRTSERTALSPAQASLAWHMHGPDRDRQAELLLPIILRSAQQVATASQAMAIGTAHVMSDNDHTRDHVTQGLRGVQVLADRFEPNLRRLPPLRRDEADALRSKWARMSEVVDAIASTQSPGGLLAQWHDSTPEHIAGAPAEVLRWIGLLAGDYGQSGPAVAFIERAVAKGDFPATRWLARAAFLALNQPETAQTLLDRPGVRDDPLGDALDAHLARGPRHSASVLERWSTADASEQFIKVVLLIGAYVDKGELNRAIDIGLGHVEGHPEQAGVALATARLLLHRGQSGKTLAPYQDFERALDLARRARDTRRTWRGDSVEPTVVGVLAAALSGDFTRAAAMATAHPLGEATAAEAGEPEVIRERAIALAADGRTTDAKAVAELLGNAHVIAFVNGIEAITAERLDEAERHLLEAYLAAESDIDKIRTAAVMVDYGLTLPDLSPLETDYPEAVQELRRDHAALAPGEDRLTRLRHHAMDSPRLALALADFLAAGGDLQGAGASLERAAQHFEEPRLMTMAARYHDKAGDPESVIRACKAAIDLAKVSWPGEFDVRVMLFDALAGLGRMDEAVDQGYRLVALDNNSASARWALSKVLIRRGDLARAWQAIAPNDDPIEPRDVHEAQIWIGLAVEHIDPAILVPRALELASRWPADGDLQGAIILNLVVRMGDEPLPDEAREALAAAQENYVAQFPESRVLRAVPLGSNDDPLAPIAEMLQARQSATRDLLDKVERLKMPLGTLTAAGPGYMEVILRRLGGSIRSRDAINAPQRIHEAASAIGHEVVVDPTAVGTLASLDPSAVAVLVGSFSGLHSTDDAYRDAQAARDQLAFRHTDTLGLDPQSGRPRITSITTEVADLLAEHSKRACEIIARSARSPSARFRYFTDPADHSGVEWLSSLDAAIADRRPYWSDDTLLVQSARSAGLPAFSTPDLIDALARTGTLAHSVAQVLRAHLIHHFHTDLDFDNETMVHAAELAGWRPEGAASALRRPHMWTAPENTSRFLQVAITNVADRDPDEVRTWIACAAIGLTTDRDDESAATNLRVLLGRQLASQWWAQEHVPFILAGVRQPLVARPTLDDPLEPVLRELHSMVAKEHGYREAQQFLLGLLVHAGPEDKATATRIILTAK